MNRIFTSLLPVCLALVSLGAVADVVGGGGTTGNADVSGSFWDELIITTVDLPAGPNACAVTCAATFINPSADTDASYEFGIGNNFAAAALGSRQIISFAAVNGDIDEENWKPIATTHPFFNLSGSQHFRCLARQVDTGAPGFGDDPQGETERASITVYCGEQ